MTMSDRLRSCSVAAAADLAKFAAMRGGFVDPFETGFLSVNFAGQQETPSALLLRRRCHQKRNRGRRELPEFSHAAFAPIAAESLLRCERRRG